MSNVTVNIGDRAVFNCQVKSSHSNHNKNSSDRARSKRRFQSAKLLEIREPRIDREYVFSKFGNLDLALGPRPVTNGFKY